MPIKSHSPGSKAFTVVELIVSIAIVSVILGVVLFNYRKSNDNLALASAAQGVAVVIRQAQVYGLSVKESATGSGIFSYAYGVYFNPTTSPSDYYIFVDKNNNKTYDAGSGLCGSATTECIEHDTIQNNVKITGICDASLCPPTAGSQMLDITFIRPNPDARVYFTDSSSNITSGPSSRARIVLTSPQGATQT